ncbi:hypothetical protein [Roseateles oligotrophus]|uniref:ABC-type amino acid transport substrate-binding protein n=1 Tax=Roseateles oligotrophus TaxID=1769250 RepID=A0ABT2YB56_9BURK|nr:hypothetical protein [Roseateles oligotrophus]MCV2367279.1 hypothetical protein [Roseateles oligotrophus]
MSERRGLDLFVIAGRWLRSSLLMLVLATLSPVHADDLVVSYRSPESDNDRRLDYTTDLLRLALDKTVASHGGYRFEHQDRMNKVRNIRVAKSNVHPNFFAVLSFDEAFGKDGLDYVRFPLHLGVVGYRVCFTAPAARAAVAKIDNVVELKKFSIGQGAGWQDVNVLRSNGFEVAEVPSYESLFAMLNKDRFDLLCRGINDVAGEMQAHPELVLDHSFMLSYAMPQFFYTHKDNQSARQRVELGLKRAYADGSLLSLFKLHFRQSIEAAEPRKRRVFKLSNSAVTGIDFDFKKYDLDLNDVSH